MSTPFDAHNWFWRRRDGRIYSSARYGYIDGEDPDFTAWCAGGGVPTWFPTDEADVESEAVLTAVLVSYGVGRQAETLTDVKRRLCSQIDVAAETARAAFITPGAGQAMTYQAKADEARRLADDDAPDASKYPLLSAEVGITKPTLAEVGELVRRAHSQWLVVGGAIEAIRLGAKAAIEAAETAESAAIVANVAWPGEETADGT